jgi:glycosyltransferase involved in cell wall biosynthesis
MVGFTQVSIVIPAYNEEKTIEELLGRIGKISQDFELIVSCDGSSDQTAALARKAGAILVEHPYNIGNGAAVKSGALLATRQWIVFMDADLQHQPEDIPKLLSFLPQYDMVVGARTHKNSTSKHRNLGNLILKHFAEKISGHKIKDLTSGFRAVKRDVFLKFIHLYPQRYSYPTTSTLAFFCSGYFVKYVDMPSIVRRSHGKSSINPLRDGLRFLHIILRIVMTFSPQKVFNPIAGILFFGGIGISLYQIMIGGAIRSLGVILLISSLIIFLNGVLADQLARLRMDLNK